MYSCVGVTAEEWSEPLHCRGESAGLELSTFVTTRSSAPGTTSSLCAREKR